MAKQTTFTLWNQSAEITAKIEMDYHGEVTEESQEQIEQLLADCEDKADAIWAWHEYCDAMESKCRENAQIFRDQTNRWKAKKQWLKDHLLRRLLEIREQQGEDASFERTWGSARIGTSERLIVEDESQVPEQYWVVKTTRTVSTSRVKAAVKAGKYDGGGVRLQEVRSARIYRARKSDDESNAAT